jgi:biopolymer transport protein ExbD
MARRTRTHDPSLEVDLPITPMLDLAFQVLLFFILTYHPSQLEGQMDLSLPDLAQGAAAKPEEAQASDKGDLDLPSEVTVMVRAKRDGEMAGEISQITVQDRSESKEITVSPRKDKKSFVDQVQLRKYLQDLRPGLANQNDIKLLPESMLNYGRVMEVMDACRNAGFNNVSLGPPPDLTPGGQKID